MTSLAIALLLALFGSAVALPVRPDSRLGPVIKIPVFFLESNNVDDQARDELSPGLYDLLLNKLNEPEDVIDDKLIQKREAKAEEQDDLETAAGNYALRPLFVYRQQMKYKQRARDGYRGRYVF